MTTTDTGPALLRAVLLAPDDDLPRLVYADWLQEHEQDDVAEMIRWGVAHPDGVYTCMGDASVGQMCGGDTVCPTCQMLEQALGVPRRMLGEDAYEIQRGFVTKVRTTEAVFLAEAEALFRGHPVERVTLSCREPTYDDTEPGWVLDSPEEPLLEERPDSLPPELWSLLIERGGQPVMDGYTWMRFPTREAALAALSDAAVAYGRERANLTNGGER